MSARCDLTDLLVDQCAHCLAHLGPPREDVHVYHTMRATFPGRCALDPDHRIEEGAWIGRTEDGWACAGCCDLPKDVSP